MLGMIRVDFKKPYINNHNLTVVLMTNPDFEGKQVGARKAAEMIFGLKLTKNKRNDTIEFLNSLESSLRFQKVEKLFKETSLFPLNWF